MRKKIYIMLAAILTAIATYGNNDKDLREIVGRLNNLNKANTGDAFRFDKAEYDGHVVTLTYLVAKGGFNFNGARSNEESFRNNMLLSYANNETDEFKKLLEAIVESDAELKIVINGDYNESFTMRYTTKELKECLSNADADPLLRLKVFVDNGKFQTPMDCGDGMTMTDIYYDARYMAYEFECDELIIDIDDLNLNKNVLKVSMLEFISNSDDFMNQAIYDLLVKLHYGVIFKFVGSLSGDDCTIYIEPNEVVEGLVYDASELYAGEDDDIDEDDEGSMELLKAIAVLADLETPTEVSDGMVMTEVTLDGSYFTYVFELDESESDLMNMIEENKELVRLMLKSQFFDDEDNRELCNILKKVHYGVKYKIVDKPRGKVQAICIEPYEIAVGSVETEPEVVEEVVEESDEDLHDPKALLDYTANYFKSQTPTDLGNGMVLTDVFLDKSYFTYVYECDELKLDLDVMNRNKDLMKSLLRSEIVNNEENKEFCDMLKQAHYGVRYKYVGASSGKVFSVSMEPEEL